MQASAEQLSVSPFPLAIGAIETEGHGDVLPVTVAPEPAMGTGKCRNDLAALAGAATAFLIGCLLAAVGPGAVAVK